MTHELALAEIIRTRLLGVHPDEQDVVLEDDDWRIILAALASKPAIDPATDGGADVMIGEFIARWEDAADGVHMDADTAEALAREFKRLKSVEEALTDLLSWFPDKPSDPEWRIKAGEYGADEALDHARGLIAIRASVEQQV